MVGTSLHFVSSRPHGGIDYRTRKANARGLGRSFSKSFTLCHRPRLIDYRCTVFLGIQLGARTSAWIDANDRSRLVTPHHRRCPQIGSAHDHAPSCVLVQVVRRRLIKNGRCQSVKLLASGRPDSRAMNTPERLIRLGQDERGAKRNEVPTIAHAIPRSQGSFLWLLSFLPEKESDSPPRDKWTPPTESKKKKPERSGEQKITQTNVSRITKCAPPSLCISGILSWPSPIPTRR